MSCARARKKRLRAFASKRTRPMHIRGTMRSGWLRGPRVFGHQGPSAFVAFQRDWLDDKVLIKHHQSLMPIKGGSMAPEILAGDLALIARSRREPRGAVIIALRAEDGPLGKCLLLCPNGWWYGGDNEDYGERPTRDSDEVIGPFV